MPSPEHDDAPVRQRIGPWAEDGLPDLSAFDPSTNYFVRAAAGSGKTTSLVARMVGLVRQGASAEHLAAITFTRKAAGEMTTRFYEELERARSALERQVEQGAGGQDQLEAVETALQDAQRTFIGTIHSFCGRILRERPLAAGLSPGFMAGLDDREKRKLRDRAWQEHLQQVHQRQREAGARDTERLANLGIEPSDLKPYFETLCTYPELDPYTSAPDEVPDMLEACRAVQELVEKWQPRRPDPLPKGRDAVMKAFDRTEKMLRYFDLGEPTRQAAVLDEIDGVVKRGRAKVTLSCWGERGSESYDAARTLRDEELPALVEERVRPALRQWNALVHKAVVGFTRPAVRTYQQMRRAEGMLTFHDILRLTRDLLRDRPEVRASLQKRYRHLLVDEFQDTDPLQAEILFYLTGEGRAEIDWTRCTPRPGSLFIVGDGKQSIYRFRRADMEVFDKVGQLITRAGGEVVDLTKNFRSLGCICDWCDAAFQEIFSEPELVPYQASYTPFDPQRPQGSDSAGLRRIPVEDVYGNKGEVIARRDAEAIAAYIRGVVDGEVEEALSSDSSGDSSGEGAVFPEGPSFSDFMILTRNKTRLDIYAEALAGRGVPYVITGSEDLGGSDELKAVVDLMTCALRPDDPVACIAFLKGPLVGMSDDALYRFRRAGGAFDRMGEPVPASALEEFGGELAGRFERAFRQIRRARALLGERRPAVAVERAIEEFGLLAGAAHPPEASEGSLRAGYLLRVITAVQHLTAQGLDWAEVLDELQRVADGDETIDGMTLETGSEDAVRVMNVHQAKGLEAPVVFLADPYSSGSGYNVTRHVRRGTGELVAPVVQGEGHYQRLTHAPLGWHDDSEEAFRQEEERHEAAEERRLLYVAATRTENLLVVSTYPKKKGAGYWSALDPFLEASDVPELEVPELEAAAQLEAPAPRLASRREERARRLERSAHPSYATTTVTSGNTETGDAERLGRLRDTQGEGGGAGGYGLGFGEALHVLFERCTQRRHEEPMPPQARIDATLEAHMDGATETDVQRARDMLRRFLESDLWKEIGAAEAAYPEYPVAELIADGGAERPVPELRRGTIDLIYRGPSGWVVVDYKTDRVSPEAELAAGLEDHPYANQVRAYSEAFTRATGATVSKAGLWFADAGCFKTVN